MGCKSVLEHLFMACGGSVPRERAEERKRKKSEDLDFSVIIKALGPWYFVMIVQIDGTSSTAVGKYDLWATFYSTAEGKACVLKRVYLAISLFL